MKSLVPNYGCLQNPWLRGYRPQITFCLSSTEFDEPPPLNKFPGYATDLTLNLTLPATHRPAAVLPLLTCQQLTVWQLNVGGILGSLMNPSLICYCVDYCRGKEHQQHIKKFNIYKQNLPTVRSAFFRPHIGVQNACQQQHSLYIGISWVVKRLLGGFCHPIGLQQLVHWAVRDSLCRGDGPW